MKIRFVGHRPRELVRPARTLQPGEVFDVPDVVGRQLLEQPRWYETVTETKTKTRAAAAEGEEGKR